MSAARALTVDRTARRAGPRRSRAAARDPASAALALQRMAGNRAVCSLQRIPVDRDKVLRELEAALEAARKELGDITRVAEDLIEQATGESIRGRPQGKVSENWIRKRLGEIAAGGGSHAGEARRQLGDIERVRREVGRLKDDLEAVRPTPQRPYAAKKREKQAKHHARKQPKPKPPGWDPTAGPPAGPRKGPNYKPAPMDKPAKPPPPPAKSPPVKATPPPVPAKHPSVPATPPVAEGGGGKVLKEAGDVAAGTAGKGRVYLKAAAKFGVAVVDGLIPDPTDAIAMMIKVAMAYDEARQEIRRRNLRRGFSVGWAAYLVVPRWDWAKWFAKTEVSRDVITLVVDAVGVAESAYNEGLVRGFIYGEKHSKRQANKVRQEAFEKLRRQEISVGTLVDGDVYAFDRNDVYRFSGALRPAANAVVDEADRRGAERIAKEARARLGEQYRKDFDEGRAPAGVREW